MKKKIPKAIREQVWLVHVGKKYESKCSTSWCKNVITVFDFQCGHDVPEAKGGATEISNLVPICSRCNLSMGDDYTFKEWVKLSKPSSKWKIYFSKVFSFKWKLFATKENGTKSLPNPMNQKDRRTKLHGFLSVNRVLPKKKRTAAGTKKSEKS